jgi:2-polyprenyl-3-methyl-5-hydroxy-6-metoxy-1,4-benzoquinol methylase
VVAELVESGTESGTTEQADTRRDALLDRLIGATNGVWDIATVYIGDRLGLYTRLKELGPATSTELASAAGLSERYVREWLEQQTASGILTLAKPSAGAFERRFALPAGHDEVLTERESLNFLAPLASITLGAISPIHRVLDAFKTGGGVPYADYGVDLLEGQAGMNRNMFLYQLGQEYLSAIPDLDARLTSDPPVRIADFGCGHAWSSIGMAQAFPKVLVDGFDLHEASVAAAQEHIRDYGLTDRVRVEVRDAGDPALTGQYDLVTAFECIHDMSDPVGALRTMRRLARDGGTVIVADERVSEEFTADAGPIESLMYGFSVLHCLPVGMVDQPSAGTGTVMRPDTLRRYAREAGFADVEILPLDNFFFNFYRLNG